MAQSFPNFRATFIIKIVTKTFQKITQSGHTALSSNAQALNVPDHGRVHNTSKTVVVFVQVAVEVSIATDFSQSINCAEN